MKEKKCEMCNKKEATHDVSIKAPAFQKIKKALCPNCAAKWINSLKANKEENNLDGLADD